MHIKFNGVQKETSWCIILNPAINSDYGTAQSLKRKRKSIEPKGFYILLIFIFLFFWYHNPAQLTCMLLQSCCIKHWLMIIWFNIKQLISVRWGNNSKPLYHLSKLLGYAVEALLFLGLNNLDTIYLQAWLQPPSKCQPHFSL